MSIVTVKSDYILKANSVYYNLKENETIFAKEAMVINHAKCILVRNEELEDFMIDGIYVRVYRNSNGYDMHFDGHVLSITVYEKQIVDFVLKRS